MRYILAPALLALTSCATSGSVRRLESNDKRLEARIEAIEQNQSAQKVVNDITKAQLADLNEKNRMLIIRDADLLRADITIARRISAVEQQITWAGRFRVTVPSGDQWITMYANGTGISQRVRLRKVSGEGMSQVRIVEISRAGSSGSADDIPTGPTPATWDMSGVGSEKWIRLGCGRELQASSPSTSSAFELLVTKDESPVSCDRS